VFQKTQPKYFQQDQQSTPAARALLVGLGLVGLQQAHSFFLRDNPKTAQALFRAATLFEERSPARLGRMFAFAERRSAFIFDEIRVRPEDLFGREGRDLSNLGTHLEKLIGKHVPGGVRGATEGFVFRRSADAADPYMHLAGHEHVRVRWEVAGRRTAASARMDAPLAEPRGMGKMRWDGEWWRTDRIRDNWQAWKNTQIPFPYLTGPEVKVAGEKYVVQPHSVMIDGSTAERARSYWERIRVNAFELFERPQRLMADVGFGLRRGSYNKVLHIPFVGEGGMLNNFLLRRVLPVVAVGTALSYADYLTHHVVSNYLAALPLKANLLRADLTDNVPGARSVTDFYTRTVPGPQYGPLALPALGATVGALVHYGRVLAGSYEAAGVSGEAVKAARKFGSSILRVAEKPTFLKYFAKSPVGIGAAAGLLAMLPFIPGMIGSRKSGHELRDIYSGREPVPVRAGRWWDMGSTPFEGGRIKEYRPHWYQLFKNRTERVSLYGSEDAYWSHNPLLHPFRWLKDPYWLEKQHYADRPYPITSPAFSNVPIIGPVLAATIGKVVKPPVRMHPEWDGTNYTLYSSRLEPKPGVGLPPPKPKEEFGFKDTMRREAEQMAEWLGMMGFLGKTAALKIFSGSQGKDVYFEGSRQMTSISRRYYERELGAGIGPEFGNEGAAPFGYTEPFRRFVQRDVKYPEANEIPNQMPSWLPGEDYFINFREGDPYAKIDMGYARLPGTGYEQMHPELRGLNPEDWPDLEKMRVLGDVAPYSQEFANTRARVSALAKKSTEVAIEYEKIMDRVRAAKQSVVKTDERRFTGDIDQLDGTVKAATPMGIELEEYPGRVFTLSSVGYSAADLSAAALAEHNRLNKSQVARDVEGRQARLRQFFENYLAAGTPVHLTVQAGSAENAERVRAVVETGDINVNQALIAEGLARYRKDQGGAETRAMHGALGNLVGSLSESLAFTGDNSPANPLRFIPSPGHTKLWQQRTVLAQYENEEAIGSKMRRWDRPVHDFLGPYLRGAVKRLTDVNVLGPTTVRRRDMNTLSDMLRFLRSEVNIAQEADGSGRYTNQASRTATGANLFSAPAFVASTLPDREAHYFRRFLQETDPKKRAQILAVVPPEMARALQAQWAAARARIDEAEGETPPELGQGGRPYTEEGLAAFSQAKTRLGYGDFMRSSEIAEFFHRTGFHLPDASSDAWDDVVDYEDVKLKIIQNEGYDMHDFGIFEDRANLLWRKPWIDGVARELTSGDTRSVENLRRQVEQLMLAARDRNPDVRTAATRSHRPMANVRVDVDEADEEATLKDMRRNPERYEEQ
jgi:hypothetical protein